MYGQYSRADYNQERVLIAGVQYFILEKNHSTFLHSSTKISQQKISLSEVKGINEIRPSPESRTIFSRLKM